MKNTLIGSWLLSAAVLVMVLFSGTTAIAQIMGFEDPQFYYNSAVEVELESFPLLFLDSYGVETSIEFTSGFWRMAFVSYLVDDPDEELVIGYADNCASKGMMEGNYSYMLREICGGLVDEIWLVHDTIGDGIGYVHSGVWTIGSDDILYTEQDILFGDARVRADLGQLPPYMTRPIPLPMPSCMVVTPEPATMAFLALGGLFFRKRYLG